MKKEDKLPQTGTIYRNNTRPTATHFDAPKQKTLQIIEPSLLYQHYTDN